MGNIGWWLLGLLAVGGGVYLYVRAPATTAALPPKDMCVSDLPLDKRTQAKAAIDGGNSVLLRTYATQADADGHACAARELRAAAMKIDVAGGTGHMPPTGSDGSGDSIFSFDKSKKKTRAQLRIGSAVISSALGYLGLSDPLDVLPDGEIKDAVRHALYADDATEAEVCDLTDTIAKLDAYPTVLKLLKVQCDAFVAARLAAEARAALSVDELPEPLRASVRFLVATMLYTSNIAAKWQELRDGGYDRAAGEIAPYLPDATLPSDLQAEERAILTSTSHDVAGWKSGGGAPQFWQRLRDAGYAAAALRFIRVYLPEGDYGTASPFFATGGG